MTAHYLEPLFAPRSVAVFGASERPDSVGARVFQNLLEGGFTGSVHPINPKHEVLRGQPCYASLQAIGQRVDLAVIATPAATVPGILRECGQHDVPAAIVLSAGFGEQGEAGKALEAELLAAAREGGMRLLGPNCLGLMRPQLGLNATFSHNVAQPGSLALISQSGALCTAILDWADGRGIGFSAMISVGDAADVGFGDLLDYLALDPQTQGILMYVEGVRDARRFMSGLRAAARMKPVVVLKAGRQAEGSRAAMSHTGALVGADDVFDAALKRAGAVRADTIEQLFAAAQLLSARPRISGNRLAIVTNAGGPGVMATDCAVERGIRLAQLEEATLVKLDGVLSSHWPRANPVDILGDATPERYADAVSACLADANVDGVLVMLTPQAMTAPTEAARRVIEASQGSDKPILACWMGETQVREGRELLNRNQIPAFDNPETSLQAFGYLNAYRENQHLLLQAPGALGDLPPPDVEGARLIVESALAERRTLLTALEVRALLSAFQLPNQPAVMARSPNEALSAAEILGFPVAMKIVSPEISHKSDAGGVRLNIRSAQAVRGAYNDLVEEVRQRRPDAKIDGVSVEKMYSGKHGRELVVGVIADPVFGPVINFGAGGIAVEILRDRAVALPPLNAQLAEAMIRRTRVAKMLDAFRNQPPIQREALVRVLLRVSEMVCELPEIQEMDLNPLVADETGAYVLDARVALNYRPPGAQRRYDHVAVHPYPAHLIQSWQLADGTEITIRPIRPEDADLEREFVRHLSPEAKYLRFRQSLQELTDEMVVRFTQLDYHRELALLATVQQDGRELELGVTRYIVNPDGESAEFALVVDDAWQNKGIGSRLLSSLIEAARERGVKTLVGGILAHNSRMLDLAKSIGFVCQPTPDDVGVVTVTKSL
ncbi:MAG TPA: GNAT family N-acetyltransferase [Methylococcaceae bacterium]|nr:GNAT family N-acetyltransferase [Methylococcaceae bacterium]